MDKHTALKIFEVLEGARSTFDAPLEDLENDQWTPPTYEVRLDAFTATSSTDRAYRIRVLPGRETGGIEEQDWRYVLDQALQYEWTVTLENNGMVLA